MLIAGAQFRKYVLAGREKPGTPNAIGLHNFSGKGCDLTSLLSAVVSHSRITPLMARGKEIYPENNEVLLLHLLKVYGVSRKPHLQC
jgi:hypothetical protein